MFTLFLKEQMEEKENKRWRKKTKGGEREQGGNLKKKLNDSIKKTQVRFSKIFFLSFHLFSGNLALGGNCTKHQNNSQIDSSNQENLKNFVSLGNFKDRILKDFWRQLYQEPRQF